MKKYLLLIFVLLIVYLLVSTLYHAGVFKSIDNNSQLKNTSFYNSIPGPEDLAIDYKKKSLFISSSNRWKINKGLNSNDGIYLLDLTKDTIPYKLATDYQEDFHPHGISYIYYKGNDYLFVINHKKDIDEIELFKYKNDTLFYIKSFSDELLNSPNDICAIDINTFYVTIDHGSKGGLMRLLEDYLRLPLSYVVYFNEDAFKKVYEGLNYANGINKSHDGNTIYITETTSGKISVLKRNVVNGEVKLLFSKKLNSGLDNITIDKNGDLWIAAHPKLLDFVAHSKDSSKISPSQVLKLHAIENDFIVSEIYLNDGIELSGSSTALTYNNTVYIGQVFNNKVMKGEYRISKK